MPDDIRTLFRKGRHRLWSVRCVAALCRWLGPVAGVAMLLAVLQRLGVLPVDWATVSIVASGALVVAVLVQARPWTVAATDAALALDHGLGLDDRLGSALDAADSDAPMALSTIAQAERAVAGRVNGGTVRRALPLQWTRGFPTGLAVVLLAVIIAGEPASKVMADEARDRVSAELATAIDAVSPLAPDNEAIAKALEQAQLPMPELESAEAIELEALRRITQLQEAVELVQQSVAVLSASDISEALRNMSAATTGEPDVDALREALTSGDFEAAESALESLAASTSGSTSSGERRSAMGGLARDLDRAAARAKALREARQGDGTPPSRTAEQALQELADDLRKCQNGQCDKPGQACKKMGACQGQRDCASSASSACNSAAGNCNGLGAGQRFNTGPMVGEDDSQLADASTPTAPEATQDEGAEIIDTESAPPGARQVGTAPVAPVGLGQMPVASPGAPSPEALRRLPARYQEAVRRFFSSTRSAPELVTEGDS